MYKQLPFNQELRNQRKLRGWSQADLAERVGSDIKTVSRWELGKTFPSPYHRQRLIELFGEGTSVVDSVRESTEDNPLGWWIKSVSGLMEQEIQQVNRANELRFGLPYNRCAGSGETRCLCIATQPAVSHGVPCSRCMGATPCFGERRPGRPATRRIVHPFRCGGICAADRVREYCQPASRALFRTPARDCHSLGDGRESQAPGRPTVDREPAAVTNFRHCSPGRGRFFEGRNYQLGSGRYPAAQ